MSNTLDTAVLRRQFAECGAERYECHCSIPRAWGLALCDEVDRLHEKLDRVRALPALCRGYDIPASVLAAALADPEETK